MELYSFDFYCENLPFFIAKALEKIAKKPANSLAFIFVGSDGNIGDSLAPLCGSLLKINSGKTFVYGNLFSTICAKEVPYAVQFIKKCHPDTLTIVIDAALGKKEDVGVIKVQSGGIKPGLGVNKNLPKTGDISVLGVLGEKRADGRALTNSRLSTVYKMAENIAKGLEKFVQINEKGLKCQNKEGFYS